MKHVMINYSGIKLEVPYFLQYYWPHTLRIENFPTYCGAGDGIGDALVPDSIYGMRVAPACLIHDIDWLVSSGTYAGFCRDNLRFLRNLLAIRTVNKDKFPVLRYLGCYRYYFAVQLFGHKNYFPVEYNRKDPMSTPAIKEKLSKLYRSTANV